MRLEATSKENLITRLQDALMDSPQATVKELDQAFRMLQGPEGKFLRGVLRSLCWVLEDKTFAEMTQELHDLEDPSNDEIIKMNEGEGEEP